MISELFTTRLCSSGGYNHFRTVAYLIRDIKVYLNSCVGDLVSFNLILLIELLVRDVCSDIIAKNTCDFFQCLARCLWQTEEVEYSSGEVRRDE